MTRTAFLTAYRAEVRRIYPWAADEARLSRFMGSVEATLSGASTWHHEGAAVAGAWHAIGGKGKPSLKALRSLL